MKKNKFLIMFVLVFGILFIPFFAGCKAETVKLKTPSGVEYQVNQDIGTQILVAERNNFASQYLFGISEKNTQNTDEFLKWIVDAKEIKIDSAGQQHIVYHNYLDVTNIFVNAKTYYFYVQYLGKEGYENSDISPINTVTIEYKLDAPIVSIDGYILNWLVVDNADSYVIYSVIGDAKELVIQTTNNSYNLQTYITNKVNSGLEEPISFFVTSLSNKQYLRSADSDVVEYTAFLQLDTPTELSVVSANNKKYLQWKQVNYCDNYTIKANYNNEILIRQENCIHNGQYLRYDISTLIEEYGLGKYNFKIRANKTNNYIQSEFSEELDWTNTSKLATPTNVVIEDKSTYIIISWNEVENANYYEVYFSDISKNYALKQFVINENGVEGSVITNSVTLTYGQMGITNFNQVVDNRFKIQIKAKGYGYYTDSDLSTSKIIKGVDEEILAPQIVDNASLKTITWSAITNAVKYNVFIVGNSGSFSTSTTETRFNYNNYIANAGSYSIKVQAESLKGRTSEFSNIINKETYEQLYAPVLTDIYAEDSEFVIAFTEAQNTQTYSLYIGGRIYSDQISKTNNAVSIVDAMQYKQNNQLVFSLSSNANGYYTQSVKSNTISVSTKLDTPTITITNNALSWDRIKNAQSYNLVLDDKFYELESSNTTLNLANYVTQTNVARQVRLQAVSAYFDSSDFSAEKYYNRATMVNEYTTKYFYYGQTYDFYITSETELFDLIEWTIINELYDVKVYLNYAPNKTIAEKMQLALENLSGTYFVKPNYQYQSNNEYNGEVTLKFKYAGRSASPTYSPQYTQYENGMVYSVNSSRDDSYSFASDSYIVSQKVWTTDGLLSAIEHHATPDFQLPSSTAEDIYNRAKALLIDICDDSMTDYEKALAIHDYIVSNVSYDTYGLNQINDYNRTYLNDVDNYKNGYFHYLEAPFYFNMAVCDGYSKMFSLLCNMEQIDCVVVGGLANKFNQSSGHAWNKISLDFDGDGFVEVFAVDCTYDDRKYENETIEYMTHEYFMIPDSYLSNRQEDEYNYHPFPATTESEEKFYSYFEFDGAPLKVETELDLSKLISFSMSHSKFKLELLIPTSYVDRLNEPQYSMFINFEWLAISYSHNANYKIVYAYK